MLDRLNQRYQEDTMACSNCTCNTVYNSDYIEIDPSPLATQGLKLLAEEEAKRKASPAGFFDRFCDENPWAGECKIHDN